MLLIKKVVKYLLANPFYAVIVAVCCVAILAIAIAIFVKISKAKKTATPSTTQPQSQPSFPEPTIEKDTSPVEPKVVEDFEETQVTATKEPEVVEEVVVTTPATESVVVAPKKTATAESKPTKEPASAVVKSEPAKTLATPTVKQQTQNAETKVKAETPIVKEVFTPIDSVEETNEVEVVEVNETTNQPDTEVSAKKTTRYNGKWLIWRLLTKTNDSDITTEESYFFELVASNGEKLLSSEGYTSFAGAQKGIQTHKANILKNNFRICLTKKGDYIFKLLSGKNSLLCTGENYPTKLRCENAVESTKRFAETAVIDENVHDLIIHIPNEENDEPIVIPDNGYNGKWIVSAMQAPDGDQIFYFELFASNGEKLLSSEEYATYNGVINGINTHKSNIERNNFRISLTKRGDYIFKLLNANDQLLCLGEHYKTRRRCENAVESVKRFAKTATIMHSPSMKQFTQN